MSAAADSPKPTIQVMREALTAQHQKIRLAADEVVETGKALERTIQDTAKIKLPAPAPKERAK